MSMRELSREQLNELKQIYSDQLVDCGEGEELINTSSILDEVIFNHYAGIDFTNDDFFCTCGK